MDGAYGVLVDPRCSKDVAQALIALLQDPRPAEAMGVAGREWVRHELHCEKFCATLRSALETECQPAYETRNNYPRRLLSGPSEAT